MAGGKVNEPKKQVFISHAFEDGKDAAVICSGLEMRGLSCWLAPRDIPLGTLYAEAISSAIENSGLLIVVFSATANESRQVISEVEAAFNKDLSIIPIFIDDSRPTGALKHYLSSIHWDANLSVPLQNRVSDVASQILKHFPGLTDDTPETDAASTTEHLSLETEQKPLITLPAGFWRNSKYFIPALIVLAVITTLVLTKFLTAPTTKDNDYSSILSPPSDESLILTYGGWTDSSVTDMAKDNSDNLFMVGHFSGTVDLCPGTEIFECTSQGALDSYLLKLDSTGAFLWAYTWHSTSSFKSLGITLDNSQNIYIVGSFIGNADFDPGSGSFYSISAGDNKDSYLLKLDTKGSFQWVRSWGDENEDEADSVAVSSSDGMIYTTGHFINTIDIDPSPGITIIKSKAPYADSYILKFDPQGQPVSHYSFGASHSIYANGIAVNDNNKILVGGKFRGTTDFGASLTSAEYSVQNDGYDAFFLQLDGGFNLEYVNTWGGSPGYFKWESVEQIYLDESGNIYIAGNFSVTSYLWDSDQKFTAIGGNDAYVVKLDPSFSMLWVRTWGGLGNDYALTLSTNAEEEIIIAGEFEGTIDINPSLYTTTLTAKNHASESYLIRIDQDGRLLWFRTWGGSRFNDPMGLDVDNAGSILISGRFTGSGVLAPSPDADEFTSQGMEDAYLCKINRAGAEEFTKTWGGSSLEQSYDVAVDKAGNIYIVGRFEGSSDFDPGPETVMRSYRGGGADSFLVKLDSSGSFQWVRDWGGPDWDYALGVDIDGSGNIYVVGEFIGDIDFDPGQGELIRKSEPLNIPDSYLVKFDSSGSVQWVRNWGGTDGDMAVGVNLDVVGNIYISGEFTGEVDLDPGPGRLTFLTQELSNDCYLIKLDSTGSLLWARTWRNEHHVNAGGVSTDSQGHVYLTANFSGSIDLNPGDDVEYFTAEEVRDAFLVQLDPDGEFVWARTLGSSERDSLISVAHDQDDNIYLLGSFDGEADLDPGTGVFLRKAIGGSQSYLLKLDKDGNLIR